MKNNIIVFINKLSVFQTIYLKFLYIYLWHNYNFMFIFYKFKIINYFKLKLVVDIYRVYFLFYQNNFFFYKRFLIY
jgi:hypothetical protein